ncbi:hypothetical protein ACFL1V_02435 [Pseudomonadota bacterium]
MKNRYQLIKKALKSALLFENRIPKMESDMRELNLRVRNLEFCLDSMIQSPKFLPGQNWAFNSQQGRLALVRRLLDVFSFDMVLETGTFLGETTGCLAKETRLPVYTCDINDRFLALARSRLAELEGIRFFREDSRTFLKDIARQHSKKVPFIYLDAHWYDDLPLVEELEIIERTWEKFLVVVDDFEVPGDEGYLYDNYGEGKSLDTSLLESISTIRKLTVFYPSLPSSKESGKQRGCAVIAANPEFNAILAEEPLLRH